MKILKKKMTYEKYSYYSQSVSTFKPRYLKIIISIDPIVTETIKLIRLNILYVKIWIIKISKFAPWHLVILWLISYCFQFLNWLVKRVKFYYLVGIIRKIESSCAKFLHISSINCYYIDDIKTYSDKCVIYSSKSSINISSILVSFIFFAEKVAMRSHIPRKSITIYGHPRWPNISEAYRTCNAFCIRS